MFIISNPKPIRPITTRHIRKLHTISISNFVRDLACHPSSTPSELHNSMLVTLDLHAPVTTTLSILRPDTSWYTSNLLEEKRLLRKLELRYNKNPHLLILDEYKTLKIKHRKALKLAKSAHISNKFELICKDSKATHRLSAQLLGLTLKHPLPPGTPAELPILFSNFFANKPSDIINSLPVLSIVCSPVTTESHLSHLTVPSLQQIVSLIESMKSCSSLDPLPLIILHQITTVLATSLLKICSRSIITGCVPDDFKKP